MKGNDSQNGCQPGMHVAPLRGDKRDHPPRWETSSSQPRDPDDGNDHRLGHETPTMGTTIVSATRPRRWERPSARPTRPRRWERPSARPTRPDDGNDHRLARPPPRWETSSARPTTPHDGNTSTSVWRA